MDQPAIFLDRDGVLNENRPDHVKTWSEFQFLPRSLAALSTLAEFPHPIVTVTNQAIINRGIASFDTVDNIHRHMLSQIERAAGRIDRIYCCPHAADEACTCRKPEPGLLFRASHELGLDLGRSVFVGDAASDIIAGQRAGCATVLVLTGRGEETYAELLNNPFVSPDAIVPDLFSGIDAILQLLADRSDHAFGWNARRGAA